MICDEIVSKQLVFGYTVHRMSSLVYSWLLKPTQEEMTELQRRLAELKDRSRCLEQQIQQQEQQVEAKELEGSVLKSCNVAQLCDVSRSLRDLVTSENRMQISVALPPSILRSVFMY